MLELRFTVCANGAVLIRMRDGKLRVMTSGVGKVNAGAALVGAIEAKKEDGDCKSAGVPK